MSCHRTSYVPRVMAATGLALVLAVSGCSDDSGTPRADDSSGTSSNRSTGTSSSADSPTDDQHTIDPTVEGIPDEQAPGITVTTGRADRCHTSDLKLTVGNQDGAAGSVYIDLQFTNTSDHTCTVYGYPGVSYVGGDDGHQIGPAATKSEGDSATLMSLAPGESASATVRKMQAGNFDAAECKPVQARGFRVYPPDETAALFLKFPTAACSGNVETLSVGPLQHS